MKPCASVLNGKRYLLRLRAPPGAVTKHHIKSEISLSIYLYTVYIWIYVMIIRDFQTHSVYMHSVDGVFSHLWALGPIQPAALRPDLLGLRWEYESEGDCQRAQRGSLTFCTSSFLPACFPLTPSHSLAQPKKQYLTQ